MPRGALSAVTLLAALAIALVAAAGAAAQQPTAEQIAAELRRAPVYQDPRAERSIDPQDLTELRREVAASGKPIYIAILPHSAGVPDEVIVDVARATQRRGTYAVVVGSAFRVASNAEPMKTALAESRAAFAAHRDEGPAAVLEDFVHRTAEPGVQGPAQQSDRGGGGPPWLLIIVLGVLLRTIPSPRRPRAAA